MSLRVCGGGGGGGGGYESTSLREGKSVFTVEVLLAGSRQLRSRRNWGYKPTYTWVTSIGCMV